MRAYSARILFFFARGKEGPPPPIPISIGRGRWAMCMHSWRVVSGGDAAVEPLLVQRAPFVQALIK